MRALPVVRVAVTWSFIACMTLASGCPSDPPSCDVAPGGVLVCPTGQTRVCLSDCARNGVEDDRCVFDPCRAVEFDAAVCTGATACILDASGVTGTCRPTAAVGLLGCTQDSAGQPGTCAGSTYCQSFTCGVAVPPWLEGSGAPGICSLSETEGEVCRDQWDTLSDVPADCGACGPGMDCDPPPWAPLGLTSVCQRRCVVDGDCPCDRPSCDDGHCFLCLDRSREECDPQGEPCCGAPQNSCLPVVYNEVGADGTVEMVQANQCCHRDLDQCASDGECCSGRVCSGGICQRCQDVPGLPAEAGGCRPGLIPRPGPNGPVCSAPCPLTDAGETCDNGSGCQQPYVCDQALGDVCGSLMLNTACARDEMRSDFCDENVEGTWRCENGAYYCRARIGIDICIGTDGGECGNLVGNSQCRPPGGPAIGCDGDGECPPGTFCFVTRFDGTEGISRSWCLACASPPPPSCWSPGEGGGCTTFPTRENCR